MPNKNIEEVLENLHADLRQLRDELRQVIAALIRKDARFVDRAGRWQLVEQKADPRPKR